MSAAVADWTPEQARAEKQEKGGATLELALVRTPDILKETASITGPLRVGFAAQTHDLKERARAKLESKGLDMIVANPIGGEGAGFGASTNEGYFLFRDGTERTVSRCSKKRNSHEPLSRKSANDWRRRTREERNRCTRGPGFPGR